MVNTYALTLQSVAEWKVCWFLMSHIERKENLATTQHKSKYFLYTGRCFGLVFEIPAEEPVEKKQPAEQLHMVSVNRITKLHDRANLCRQPPVFARGDTALGTTWDSATRSLQAASWELFCDYRHNVTAGRELLFDLTVQSSACTLIYMSP